MMRFSAWLLWAWVLWGYAEGNPSSWTRIESFQRREECDAPRERVERNAQSNPANANSPIRFVCLPDTVDPRGVKR